MAKRRAGKRRAKRRGKSKGARSTPDLSKVQISTAPEEAGAFPLFPGETDMVTPELPSRDVINVPAKSVAGTARTPESKESPGNNEKSEEDESKEKSLEWRRKATSRRLQANRPDAGSSVAAPAKDYEPEFTPLRMPDWAPEFDQMD